MFRNINGIDKGAPGYKHIMIRPQPDQRIEWAKRTFESEFGPIVSDWSRMGDKFYLEVYIPCNTTADVVLPDGTCHKVGSGPYSFECMVN